MRLGRSALHPVSSEVDDCCRGLCHLIRPLTLESVAPESMIAAELFGRRPSCESTAAAAASRMPRIRLFAQSEAICCGLPPRVEAVGAFPRTKPRLPAVIADKPESSHRIPCRTSMTRGWKHNSHCAFSPSCRRDLDLPHASPFPRHGARTLTAGRQLRCLWHVRTTGAECESGVRLPGKAARATPSAFVGIADFKRLLILIDAIRRAVTIISLSFWPIFDGIQLTR